MLQLKSLVEPVLPKKCICTNPSLFRVAALRRCSELVLQSLSGSVRLDVLVGLRALAAVKDLHRVVPHTLRCCPGWVFRDVRCEPPPGSQSCLWPRLVTWMTRFLNNNIKKKALMQPRWGYEGLDSWADPRPFIGIKGQMKAFHDFCAKAKPELCSFA